MSSTERIERLRQRYINTKPSICYERARIFTNSHKKTEGEHLIIRRAKAFKDFCDEFLVEIFPDELIVGTAGLFPRSAILTPEFSWKWVDKEIDSFSKRPQDPYEVTDDQIKFIREEIFPYWRGKSLEEHFLNQVPTETSHIGVDTGVIDNDSKWRQAVGEITPDYEDILFKKGFKGIKDEAEKYLRELDISNPKDLENSIFYEAVILVCEGIINFAHRYGKRAYDLYEKEKDLIRKDELLKISEVCYKVPENPPKSFHEAVQFVCFTQLGGIISENPLALNLGRFDKYMYPYYINDINSKIASKIEIEELVEALWLKLSEWVWTISSNTAGFFAGYNQFQNLTVGGKDRNGEDGTNELSYICLNATKGVKTHQPGLSVRIHSDCPPEFLDSVCELVSLGTGFPAIHNDDAGSKMLLSAGYEPEDARDWNNCGCVVPHFRKTGQWTSAVNVNFGAALEYALNKGKSRLNDEKMGISTKNPKDYKSYSEVEAAFLDELKNLIHHSVISTLTAQRLHYEMVPRPFLSCCVDDCLKRGLDLSRGGAHYNVGPVLTGIGLAVVANSLAAIKKLIFDENIYSMSDIIDALDNDWNGYEELRNKALSCPKYGNDDDYVDKIAILISNYFYRITHSYKDIFGSCFNSAFMGISNYIPTGKVVGATPCGRKAFTPLTEGVSPFAGSDIKSPLSVMRSSGKINHDVHTGGTLLNLRLGEDMLKTKRGLSNLGALIRSYFSLGAFHVQFNTISTKTLRDAQANPDNYRDLLVRVAGYSTQFINLSKELQEAIIARNAHDEF